MHKTFFFQTDQKGDQVEFLSHARSQGYFVYAGVEIQLNRGWKPDLIEVTVDDNSATLRITLFELESNEDDACAKARRYLPESSKNILTAFLNFLNRVLKHSRSTADSRAADIQQLVDALGQAADISVWTAAALRSPPKTVERLPLIDQGAELHNPAIDSQTPPQASSPLTGELLLSPRDHMTHSIDPHLGCSCARMGQKRCDSSGMA